MSSQSLTQFLLSHPSTRNLYELATKAPFLRFAGEGKLPLESLSQWLSQDRLYAQAYVRFIGGLISRVRLPLILGDQVTETTSTIEWRILRMFSSALQGIMTELQFFETTADQYGINLQSQSRGEQTAAGFGPNKFTSEYINLFDSFHGTTVSPQRMSIPPQPTMTASKSLLEGVIVLWATEKVYHDAWTYARSCATGNSHDHSADLDGGALNKEFIPNWTSKDFAAFVEEIEACLNTLAATAKNSEEVGLRVGQQVLELERDFWPKMRS